MTKRLPIFGTPAASLCSECGGECCKSTPGAYAPEDFFNGQGKLDIWKLYEMMRDGEAVLGVYDGDPRYAGDFEDYDDEVSVVYYPKPPYKKGNDRLVDARLPWNLDGCARLKEDGCELEFEDRPFGRRSLVPIQDEDGEFKCRQPFDGMSDKQFLAIKWLAYAGALMTVAKMVEPDSYWGT